MREGNEMEEIGRRRYITCAYCESKFEETESWLEHIPCPEAGKAEGEGQRDIFSVQAAVPKSTRR